MANKDTRNRKWQLTINNYEEKGYTIDTLEQQLLSYGESLIYGCFGMEKGLEEETPHVHIFLQFENARKFSTIKNSFIGSHIEMAKGTAQENRDYIRKEGKYLNSEKSTTTIEGTFREFGTIPTEQQGKRRDLEILKELIEDGLSNKEIIDYNPSYIKYINDLDLIRSTFIEDKFKNIFRNIEATYICGDSRTGKTRFVMDEYGYNNVYRISNYKHPFDKYSSQDVIIFEEFRDSISLEEMLIYLEGYPTYLPARYNDRIACFTKIFIISNIPFEKQFEDVKEKDIKTYNAFKNRINHFITFTDVGIARYYEDFEDYNKGFNYKILNLNKEERNDE